MVVPGATTVVCKAHSAQSSAGRGLWRWCVKPLVPADAVVKQIRCRSTSQHRSVISLYTTDYPGISFD